jgi:hypothetical protein
LHVCTLEVIVPPLAIVSACRRNRQCSHRYSCSHNCRQTRSPVGRHCHEHLGTMSSPPRRLCRIHVEASARLLPCLDGTCTLEQHAATRWCYKSCRTPYQLHGEDDQEGYNCTQRLSVHCCSPPPPRFTISLKIISEIWAQNLCLSHGLPLWAEAANAAGRKGGRKGGRPPRLFCGGRRHLHMFVRRPGLGQPGACGWRSRSRGRRKRSRRRRRGPAPGSWGKGKRARLCKLASRPHV